MKDETFITAQKPGHCAGCGKKMYRYSETHRWYICVDCNSLDVMEDIAEHVMYPNGRPYNKSVNADTPQSAQD